MPSRQPAGMSNYSSKNPSTVTVVLGAQIGDEGKGKLVDLLASEADVVCRFQGGNNAGHTVIANDTMYYFEALPSGFHLNGCVNIIGNGCVVNLPMLYEEIKEKESQGVSDWSQRLLISERAHLIFDFHKELDIIIDARRGKNKIGTTHNGIGPTYSSKIIRNGIRMIDLMLSHESFAEKLRSLYNYYKNSFPELNFDVNEALEKYKVIAEVFRPMTIDTIGFLNKCVKDGSKKIVIEGAQGTMLDIDFGIYPHVTSSACGIGGVLSGLGLAPKYIDNIYGVVRAYMYRYGTGFFPTQLNNETGKYLFTRGNEQTNTDGINGRCGWLDLVMVKYTDMINGYTALCLTKLDVLDELAEIKVAIAYTREGVELQSFPSTADAAEDIKVKYMTFPGWLTSTSECRQFDSLPINAKRYVQFIETYLGIPIKWIGVGRDRAAIIRVF